MGSLSVAMPHIRGKSPTTTTIQTLVIVSSLFLQIQAQLTQYGYYAPFDAIQEYAKEDMRMSDDYPDYEGGLVYKQENDELEKRSERNRWDLDEDKKLAIKYLQRVVKKNEW